MFKIIKAIMQAIKELKELDETPYEWTKTSQLTAKELEKIGSESFGQLEKRRKT